MSLHLPLQEVVPMNPITSSTGLVRLHVQTEGRWLTVGPFSSLAGARHLAEDLIADRAVQQVRVEHRNSGRWRPAWSFFAGLTLLLLAATGCNEPPQARWVLWVGQYSPQALMEFPTLGECQLRVSSHAKCLPVGVIPEGAR